MLDLYISARRMNLGLVCSLRKWDWKVVGIVTYHYSVNATGNAMWFFSVLITEAVFSLCGFDFLFVFLVTNCLP